MEYSGSKKPQIAIFRKIIVVKKTDVKFFFFFLLVSKNVIKTDFSNQIFIEFFVKVRKKCVLFFFVYSKASFNLYKISSIGELVYLAYWNLSKEG